LSRKLGIVGLSLLILLSSTKAMSNSNAPVRVYGNLGYFFTYTESNQGSVSNNTVGTLSLNADSYIWRPWFATFNIGGTSSLSRSQTETTDNNVDILQTHGEFSLIPRSRYPFRLSFNTNNNVSEWGVVPSFGEEYRSQYLNARQSVILPSGDRLDAWYTTRSRNYFDTKYLDDTVGGKLKVRGLKYNLYANGTYQERKREGSSDKTKNVLASLTHNYFPTSDFYIKTLLSDTYFSDGSESDISSVFLNRKTNTSQMSSLFYWRPIYRPYTLTGGMRAYRRDSEISNADDNVQIGVDANIAANYTLTRRTRLTATANASVLHMNQVSDARNTNQSLLLSYRSDKWFYRNIGYHWFANAGIGNQVNIEFESTDFSQNLNGSIGHTAQRVWITGNRSSMKFNFTQSARDSILSEDLENSLNISHSATLFWNEELSNGRFYTQLSALDSRNIDEETETQILNYQFSRIVPVNRLSQWGAHVSVQSSRRYTAGDNNDAFLDGFLTTASGRLNYQHGRLFGIYKLKFRLKLDVSSTANRDGDDRQQADLEARMGYNIGKLSTALIGREVWSDTGIGTFVLMFQLNRSF